MTASLDVQVRHYRQILLWPFRLEPRSGDVHSPKAPWELRQDAVAAMEKHGWQEEKDLLHHISDTSLDDAARQAAYQEFAYFHPFVQDFLYDITPAGKGNRLKERPIRLLRYGAFDRVRVSLNNSVTGPFCVTFKVDRINLYLFDTLIAVLVIEIATADTDATVEGGGSTRAMTLAHAQTILEQFRRVYPPFWYKDEESQCYKDPGLFPLCVQWFPHEGGVCVQHRPPEFRKSVDAVVKPETGRQLPIADHWRALLKPLLPAATDGGKAELRQVIDERIPHMLYLKVDDPSAIHPGDWMRLAMADEADKELWPCGPAFRHDFERDHCYDRHWHPNATDGTVDAERSSRYLFSGYGFAAVGGADNFFFRKVLPAHFRRHYFQMGLLAQFEVATLLAASHNLANAVGTDTRDRPERVRGELERLLHFTQRYWFVDLSNQVQAREMFRLWRRHLNTEALYAQVMNEARAVTALLDAQETRNSTDATTRLTRIAAAALVPTLATGFLGMNVLVAETSGTENLMGWGRGGWTTFAWAMAVATALLLAAVFLVHPVAELAGWLHNKLQNKGFSPKWLSWGGPLIGLAVFGGIAYHFSPANSAPEKPSPACVACPITAPLP